jgi:hypothetical protein
MAYYIFLKSLRSLEEFRKNPHVKIPPKSPSTNFQSLGKFKNPIFNSEIPFFHIFAQADLVAHSASGPASPLAAPPPQAKTVPAGPPSDASVASSWEIRLPFWFTPSEPAASPSSLCQLGPNCQLHLPPPAARARLHRHHSPATERRLAPRLGCHRTVTTSLSFSLP